jgi:hypothetical protein
VLPWGWPGHLLPAAGRPAAGAGRAAAAAPATTGHRGHPITSLTRVLTEGRLEDRLKVYTVPRLLIIDEIAYLTR